jgi:hypothetical protein
MKCHLRICCEFERPDGDGTTCLDVEMMIDIPFLPAVGMLLQVSPLGGSYYPVERLSWSAHKPHIVEVDLTAPEKLQPWAEMKPHGWQLS